MLATYVSLTNGCTYCTGVHSEVAFAFGMEEEVLKSLSADHFEGSIDNRLKPILLLAKKLTASPSRVIQADIDAILEEGWNEQTVEDAIAVCALFNYYNRMMDGLGIKGSQFLYSGAGKILSQRGYKFPGF